MHKILMSDLGMTRREYLSANRKQQPLPELKRKALKSARLKSKLWTQEQIDYASASAVELSMRLRRNFGERNEQ